MRNHLRVLVAGLLIPAGVVLADEETPPVIPVAAAAEEPAATEAKTEDKVTRIDEVMVTATKRRESVRDIPATVNALTSEDIERLGVQEVDDIVKQVPGMNLTNDGINPKRVTIRGVTAEIGTNLTTGVLIGDVPFSDPYLPRVALDPNPFDLASVEVLKGPVGTLFGGSGLNGVIRYVPEAPKFGVAEVKYFAQYADYGSQGGAAPSYGAALNLPLGGQDLALRVMAFKREAPGYVDDLQSGEQDVNSLDQSGYRAMLAWAPGERWNFSLMHMAQESHVADYSFTDNQEGRLERGDTPRPSPSDTSYDLTSLGIEYRFDWATAMSSSAVINKEFRGFFDSSRLVAGGRLPVLSAVPFNSTEGFVQELRLVSPDDSNSPWKWLGGAFLYQVDLRDCLDLPSVGQALPPLPLPLPGGILANACAENAGTVGGSILTAHFEADVQATEMALFGEVSRKLFERWEATLGARFYKTESDGDTSLSGPLYATQLQKERSANVTAKGVSPKASLSFRYSRDLTVYATASRGFRFGGIQATGDTLTADVPDTYQSDSIWNYELGLRSSWFDNQLLADASAYLIDWDKPQTYQLDTATQATYIANVGSAKGQGVEATLRYRPGFFAGLMLSSSVAYNDTTTQAPFTTAAGKDVPIGTDWPLSPHFQASNRIEYALPLGTWSLGVQLAHTHSSQAWFNLDQLARVYGYDTYDVRINASNDAWTWLPTVSLAVTNLTDERGVTSDAVTQVSGRTAYRDTAYLPPRALTLRLDGRF